MPKSIKLVYIRITIIRITTENSSQKGRQLLEVGVFDSENSGLAVNCLQFQDVFSHDQPSQQLLSSC